MGKKTFSCVKWLLTFFNFLFLICGLAICGLGIWMFVSPSTSNELIGKNLAPIIGYIVLGCGGTIILISFCGCAGAGLENRCLLCLFFTVLCGIFVACLVASILVSIFRKDLSKLTKDQLTEKLKTQYGSNSAWTEFWDIVQTKFSCCGVEFSKSHAISVFQKTRWYENSKPNKLPDSCCKMKGGQIENVGICRQGNENGIHENGCMTVVMKSIGEQYIIVLSALITLAVVLIFGMCLSLAHLRNIINIRYNEYAHPI